MRVTRCKDEILIHQGVNYLVVDDTAEILAAFRYKIDAENWLKLTNDVKSDKILTTINNMVKTYYSLTGKLYPSVMFAELMELQEKYLAAGGDKKLLPKINPPGPGGYICEEL